MTEVSAPRKLHIWSLGGGKSGIRRISKLFVYVGKVIDHLSVTFYFGFSDKEYLKRFHRRDALLIFTEMKV